MTEPFNGKRLYNLLLELDWSQIDMAVCLGVSKRIINKTISGRLRAPEEVEAFWLGLERLVTDQELLARGMRATRGAIEELAAQAPKAGRWVKVEEPETSPVLGD